MGRKSVKRNYIKGGLLANRSGFNAQTYCCEKQNVSDRGGVNCKKSYTGQCATIGMNAKMRCFNKYPDDGSEIQEGDGKGCEFVTGAASKTLQGVAGLGTAVFLGNQAYGRSAIGTASILTRRGGVSNKRGLSVKIRRKSNKKRSTKHSKTSKKRHA